MPSAGIKSLIEPSKSLYVNLEEPNVRHSIVDKCVKLSAGFQVSLVTIGYENKGDGPMSSGESEGIILLIVVFWFGTNRVA